MLIVLIALGLLGLCRFLGRRDFSAAAWKRALAVLAALVALLAAQLIRCLCRCDMRWWERLLLFPVAALCALLAAFFAAEAAPALKGFVQPLFA